MIDISEMFSFLQDNKLTIVPICGRCGGKCYIKCLEEYCDGGTQNEYDPHVHFPGHCPECRVENLLIHVLRGFSNLEIRMKEIESDDSCIIEENSCVEFDNVIPINGENK